MNNKRILPPTIFEIAAVALVALHLTLPIAILVRYPLNLAGIVFILFGSVLNIWADQLFKKLNTTVKPYGSPSAFVVQGPFAWCRNPMYLGMLSILFGISIVCGSLASFIVPIVFWIIIRTRFIPLEERSMLTAFGEEYVNYTKKVPRWM